jgi:hypothetical protein
MNNLKRTILLVICLTVFTGSDVIAQSYRSDNWFPVYVDGKAGFIDRSGKIVLEPKYDGASYFYEGLARVSFGRDTIITEGFSQGFIDETGEVVIRGDWDVVSHFSDGLAAVGYDQTKQKFEFGGRTFYTSASHPWYRWGFIDRTGKLVIDTRFSDVSEFRDGIAPANTDPYEPKYGFIDKQGNWIIKPQFEHARQFSEGQARVFVKRKYGYIDRTGKTVIRPKYSWARDFAEGLACVKLGGDVLEPVGMSVTRHNADHGFIDRNGKVKFKVGRGGCQSFSNGIARVAVGPGHRAIDRSGNFLFDRSLDIWSDFSEGLAEIYIPGNEIGFVDITGQIVIRKPFGRAEDFYRGLAEVCESYDFGAKCGYIDKTGKVIWEPSR